MNGDKYRMAMLAYYFPPVGGGGTARTVGFERWLPEFGVSSQVFTVETSSHASVREFSIDDSIVDGLGNAIRIPKSGRFQWFRNLLFRTKVFPVYWALAYRWEYEGIR